MNWNRHISFIMENFPLDRVREYMVQENWPWHFTNQPPSLHELREFVQKNLLLCAHDGRSFTTGGFDFDFSATGLTLTFSRLSLSITTKV